MELSKRRRLGRALRDLRVRAGLTQVQLSDLLDLNQGWISKVERGAGQATLDTIVGYLRHTGSSPYDLIDRYFGDSPDPDAIAERVLALYRLGPLTEGQRKDMLGKVHRLGLELVMASRGKAKPDSDPS